MLTFKGGKPHLWFSPASPRTCSPFRALSNDMGISSSAEDDQRPTALDPCRLLKKAGENFPKEFVRTTTYPNPLRKESFLSKSTHSTPRKALICFERVDFERRFLKERGFGRGRTSSSKKSSLSQGLPPSQDLPPPKVFLLSPQDHTFLHNIAQFFIETMQEMNSMLQK